MKTIDQMTDDELSQELHSRRTRNRANTEALMVNFGAKLTLLLDEFEKISGGKRIVRGTYGGYRVEEPKK